MIGNLHPRKWLALLAISFAHPVFADDAVVGSGTLPSCTEFALDTALGQLYPGVNFPGGSLSFNCGPDPVVIPVSTRKTLTGATIVDGGGRITLDGQNGSAIFAIDGTESIVEIRGMDLFRGRAFNSFGGAINVGAGTSLLMVDSKIRASFASFSGGAIHVEPGAGLRIERSELIENTAANGGAIASNGSLTLIDCTFSGNVASVDQGGAVQAWFGGVTASGSQFLGNNARNGGALLLRGGISNITTSNFDGNTAVERGGAMALYEGATATGSQLAFTGNDAADGGALHLGGVDAGPSPNVPDFGARALISSSRFDANSSSATGGAITIFAPPPGNGGLFGQLILTTTQLARNLSVDGGAIWSSGQLVGIDLLFEGNAAFSGGALSLEDSFDPNAAFNIGFTQLKRTTLRANTASTKGGGMYLLNALPIFESVNVIGNAAQFGGGIAVLQSSAPIRNVSLIDNQATQGGGGIYVENTPQIALDNLTFSGNRTLNPDARGGDMFAGNFGAGATQVQISHSTLFGGVAASGSAAYTHAATSITFSNSIVLGFGADTCAGTGSFVSANGNFMAGGCNPNQSNDVPISSVGELGLGVLSNNGVFVMAHVPIVASPVVDHVVCAPGRTADQRNLPAPIDGDGNGSALCDSGAIERQLFEAPADIVLLKDGFEQPTD